MNNFVIEKNQNLLTISCKKPQNPLAPSWKFDMWMYLYNDVVFLTRLNEYLLNNENYVIENFNYYNDGSTGLGKNSVTSRYNSFNLLKMQDPIIESFESLLITQFKNYIKMMHSDLLKDTEFDPYINCWYNVMTPGQQIDIHSHNLTENSFLSGHFTVQCEESYTYYVCPYVKDRLEFENNQGEGIFFPSYIEHGTSVHIGKNRRTTIAFDIYYNNRFVNENIRDNLKKFNIYD